MNTPQAAVKTGKSPFPDTIWVCGVFFCPGAKTNSF